MKAEFSIVIPARMASQRLPGKPLFDIAGLPLLQHVYLQARKAQATRLVIATDHQAIFDAASAFGAEVIMTSGRHQSGSDRIAECADQLGWGDDHLIVNLQGDEPLMPPACLDQVATLLAEDPAADVASLYWPLDSSDEVANPNVVKLVLDARDYALYFSRAVIPFPRNEPDISAALATGLCWNRHIGLYAYRAGALRAFAAMTPTPLEDVEKLEQLRFLESGYRIRMAQASAPIPAGVDSPEDLQRVRIQLEAD